MQAISKQGQPQPHVHSKARILISPQLQKLMVYLPTFSEGGCDSNFSLLWFLNMVKLILWWSYMYCNLMCQWVYSDYSVCNIHVERSWSSQANKAVKVKLASPKAKFNPNATSSPPSFTGWTTNILRIRKRRNFSNKRPRREFKTNATKTRNITKHTLFT